MTTSFDRCVIVTRKTELEELIQRFNTASQAKFYLESAGEDFASVEARHETYMASLNAVRRHIKSNLKLAEIDRSLLPQFDFQKDVVMAIGRDGLVSNTAKYLREQPLIGVNPDVANIEGVLLPWTPNNSVSALHETLLGKSKIEQVTLARAVTNDGRELLAFNDLFIGQAGHASAVYEIHHGGAHEVQSSSGVIVSTGAGSTGWMKSIYTGAQKIFHSGAEQPDIITPKLTRSADALLYAVREPWPSKKTGTNIVNGTVSPELPLAIHSRMAGNGVIFSDGMEWDFLDFNAGTRVEIGIAAHKSQLVVK
jgi:NAD kinase